MLDTEMLGDKAVLRPYLIFIIELREGHAHPVRGLRHLPAPSASGTMMKYLAASSGCPAPGHFAGEIRAHHALAGAARTVQHQHRLARRVTDCHIVQLQLGEDLAGVKAEVRDRPIARLLLWRVGRECVVANSNAAAARIEVETVVWNMVRILFRPIIVEADRGSNRAAEMAALFPDRPGRA